MLEREFIYKYLRFFLVALSIGGIFASGMIYRLGVGFLPIIEKMNILYVLVSYIGLIAAFLSVFMTTLSLLFEFSSGQIKRMSEEQGKRYDTYNQVHIYLGIMGIIGMLLWHHYLGNTPFRGYFIRISFWFNEFLSPRYGVGVILNTWLWVAAIYGIFFIYVKFYNHTNTKNNEKYGDVRWFPLGQMLIQIAFTNSIFFAGHAWVNELQLIVPRVNITLHASDYDLVPATIVMPAIDGILIFHNNQEAAEFLSWSVIKEIELRI